VLNFLHFKVLLSSVFIIPPPFREVLSCNFIVGSFTCSDISSSNYTLLSTGQQEVNSLVRRLRRAFPFHDRKKENENKSQIPRNETENMESETEWKGEVDEEEMELDMQKAIQNARKVKRKQKREVTLPDINLDSYSIIPADDTEVDLVGEDDLGDIESDEDGDELNLRGLAACQPMWVLPLYSLLPSNKQALVSSSSVLHLMLQLSFVL
jgi:ATP-dependent RNA helicase DHX37/DHR1